MEMEEEVWKKEGDITKGRIATQIVREEKAKIRKFVRNHGN